tara:strand:- start:325 stop:777 length:453 start_codon:yes stop_codon:yes gene_type:complete
MTYFDIFSVLAALLLGIIIWLPIYKITISKWVGDSVVSRVESGDIDLNYLLDEGGVFDELSARVVSRLKMNMLAEMGQLSHQSAAGDVDASNPVAVGLDMSKELLKMVGMKNPPAMLQIKVAQALQQMGERIGVDSGPLEPTDTVDLEFI